MKFIMEVDLDAVAGEPIPELERILRYWGGNMRHYHLDTAPSETVSDTEYTPVGEWRIEP